MKMKHVSIESNDLRSHAFLLIDKGKNAFKSVNIKINIKLNEELSKSSEAQR